MANFINEEQRKEKFEKLRKSRTVKIVVDDEVQKCTKCGEELHTWGSITWSLVCQKCGTINKKIKRIDQI